LSYCLSRYQMSHISLCYSSSKLRKNFLNKFKMINYKTKRTILTLVNTSNVDGLVEIRQHDVLWLQHVIWCSGILNKPVSFLWHVYHLEDKHLCVKNYEHDCTNMIWLNNYVNILNTTLKYYVFLFYQEHSRTRTQSNKINHDYSKVSTEIGFLLFVPVRNINQKCVVFLVCIIQIRN